MSKFLIIFVFLFPAILGVLHKYSLVILEMDLLSGTYLLAVLLACIVFQSGAQEKNYTVREELPENVLIGNLLKDLNLTLDPDAPLSSPLQFKLVYKTGDVPLVRVEENTGEIFTTANRIDREKLCAGIFSENRCFYEVEVAVLPDEVFRLVKIRFLIEDINDNAPLFPSTVINISIPENTAINSRYSVPSAIDPDIGVNGIQHYELLKVGFFHSSMLLSVLLCFHKYCWSSSIHCKPEAVYHSSGTLQISVWHVTLYP